MSEEEAARLAARPSIAYLMAVVGEVLRNFPVDMLDLVIVTTISDANLKPPPGAKTSGSKPGAAADEPEPERVGISRNAVSRLLNVPLETVRRRIGILIEKQVLAEREDGIVFLPGNPLGLGNNASLWAFNMEKLRELLRALRTLGVDLDAHP
jgi:hypothetical protein